MWVVCGTVVLPIRNLEGHPACKRDDLHLYTVSAP